MRFEILGVGSQSKELVAMLWIQWMIRSISFLSANARGKIGFVGVE
jgi:hypothetical protein